jgi:BirA family transcriptional regulator, biotin operon repressor / biotin---[acetyl-CoA-carboxylase] ligase
MARKVPSLWIFYTLSSVMYFMETETLDVGELQRQLRTQYFGVGDRLLYLPVVVSTNTVAMQLAHDGSDEGVVVLADSQTAGKGRQGRRWVDMYGCNVLSSTLLRPRFQPHLLVMIASLAVVDAIADTTGISATIKWPNDVLIGNQKVAGILIETSHDQSGQLVAILGIGVNVNGHLQNVQAHLQAHPKVGQSLVTMPPGRDASETQGTLLQTSQAMLRSKATTLEIHCGHKVSRELFIAHLLQHIEADYLALQHEAANPFSSMHGSTTRSIRERWRSQLSTLGCPIEVCQGGTVLNGIAEDVDGNGELLLRRHSGELVNITWGDVDHLTG